MQGQGKYLSHNQEKNQSTETEPYAKGNDKTGKTLGQLLGML